MFNQCSEPAASCLFYVHANTQAVWNVTLLCQDRPECDSLAATISIALWSQRT